jgi:hypothetical protein
MEGYDLISAADDKKLGTVVRDEGDYVVFEHGMLRKQYHAVPKTTVDVDAERREVRTTLAKELVEDSPKVDDDGFDREQLSRYYGLADVSEAPPTEGYGDTVATDPAHGAETEEQAAGLETAVEQRARIREGGTSGDRPGGIPQESPAMLGERYSSADVPEEER